MTPPDEVVEYDPGWPAAFDRIRTVLEPAVAGVAVGIEHVGSTAVPGLAAKPIVDVDVVVGSPDLVGEAVAALVALGYIHLGDLGVQGREAFRAPDGLPYHHLYVVVAGSPPHQDHVLLRDHLRTHPDDVRRYAERKRDVAHLLKQDRDAYLEAKSGVVRDILAAARGAAAG